MKPPHLPHIEFQKKFTPTKYFTTPGVASVMAPSSEQPNYFKKQMRTIRLTAETNFWIYIPLHHIISAESKSSYTIITLCNDIKQSIIISHNLKWLEAELEGKGFIRISRHCLINSRCISMVQRWFKEVRMNNGTRFTVIYKVNDQIDSLVRYWNELDF